jgi:hypothetical protein
VSKVSGPVSQGFVPFKLDVRQSGQRRGTEVHGGCPGWLTDLQLVLYRLTGGPSKPQDHAHHHSVQRTLVMEKNVQLLNATNNANNIYRA